MADRGAGKAKRRPAKAKRGAGSPVDLQPVDASRSSSAPADTQARIRALEAERGRLKSQLEAALARISALEQGRELVRNRIDWVIDSLHNLLDE